MQDHVIVKLMDRLEVHLNNYVIQVPQEVNLFSKSVRDSEKTTSDLASLTYNLGPPKDYHPALNTSRDDSSSQND